MGTRELTMFKIAFVVTVLAMFASTPRINHLRFPVLGWTNPTPWTACPEGSPTGCAGPGDMVFVGP